MDAIDSLAPCLHHATVRFQAPCLHHSYSASTPQLQPGALASLRNKQSATTLLCLYRRDAKSGEFGWLGEVGRFMATGADAARVNPGKIGFCVSCAVTYLRSSTLYPFLTASLCSKRTMNIIIEAAGRVATRLVAADRGLCPLPSLTQPSFNVRVHPKLSDRLRAHDPHHHTSPVRCRPPGM
jgi:hypothetical protein